MQKTKQLLEREANELLGKGKWMDELLVPEEGVQVDVSTFRKAADAESLQRYLLEN